MLMRNNQSSWADARDGTTSAAASDTGDTIIVRNAKTTAGGTKYSVARMYVAFDTSDIKEVPAHAKLDLRVSSLVGDGTGFRVVKVQAGATGD